MGIGTIVGMVTGIAGMLISIRQRYEDKSRIVCEFLNGMADPKFIEARSVVYKKNGEPVNINDEDMSYVVNYIHQWGLLARKGYLPWWVFDYGSGAGVIRLYKCSEAFIEKRREVHNDNTYAYGFEWLYHALEERNNHKKNFLSDLYIRYRTDHKIATRYR